MNEKMRIWSTGKLGRTEYRILLPEKYLLCIASPSIPRGAQLKDL